MRPWTPPPTTRRTFLRLSLGGLAACGKPGEPLLLDDTGADLDPLAGGELVEVLPFVDEEERELEVVLGEGLDARQILDLTTLDEGGLVIATERFFLRTAAPVGLDPAGWTVRLGGLVEAEVTVTAEELAAEATDQGALHVECSGNTNYGGFGLQSAATFAGVPVADLLDRVVASPGATMLEVTGFDEHPPATTSEPGASWIFALADLEAAGAFLATAMNGEPLTPDHGAPVRLVVPGWYGCTMIKWVTDLSLVGDDAPATGQMQEFASRTHQLGVPALAKDYLPAEIDPAAAPIRVERWNVDGEDVYRIVGLVWGGPAPVTALRVHFDDEDGGLVTIAPARTDAATWSLWSAIWRPGRSGRVGIWLTVDDEVRTRRLDDRYYERWVVLP